MKIRHFRDDILPTTASSVTVVYEVFENSDDMPEREIVAAFSVCNPKDDFIKKFGVAQAKERMESPLAGLSFRFNAGVSIPENLLAILNHALATSVGSNNRHMLEKAREAIQVSGNIHRLRNILPHPGTAYGF